MKYNTPSSLFFVEKRVVSAILSTEASKSLVALFASQIISKTSVQIQGSTHRKIRLPSSIFGFTCIAESVQTVKRDLS
jgi:hypothetical protein